MSGLLKAAQRLVNHLKSSSLVIGRYFITVVQVAVSKPRQSIYIKERLRWTYSPFQQSWRSVNAKKNR